jgi:methionine synthase I (cobalamin-dependent)
MPTLIETLAAQRPVLTDGAWGTQLQARGLAVGACPDAWNLTHPERVQEIAEAYVAAGSRIILTNTFGANRLALQRCDLAHRTAEINRLGIEIARRAAGNRAYVFASLGPTGVPAATDAQRYAAFLEQAEALAEAGADALLLETMLDLREATLAVRGAKATELPVVACMAFGIGANVTSTLSGHSPEQIVASLMEAGADALGANCGTGAESLLEVCRRLRAATSLPLWMKPNAGLPTLIEGRAVYSIATEGFVAGAHSLLEAGADFIGGCCGTTPDLIRALAQTLSAHPESYDQPV